MERIFDILEIAAPFVIMLSAVIMILPDVIEDYKNWKKKREE